MLKMRNGQRRIKYPQKRKVELEDKIKFLLLPEDPNDGKNIIMELWCSW